MNSSQPYMMGQQYPHVNYQNYPHFGYIPSHNNYTTSSQFTGNETQFTGNGTQFTGTGTRAPMAAAPAAQYQPYVNQPAATGYPTFGYFPSQNIYSTNSSQFTGNGTRATATTTARYQPYIRPAPSPAHVYPAMNYSQFGGAYFNYQQNFK